MSLISGLLSIDAASKWGRKEAVFKRVGFDFSLVTQDGGSHATHTHTWVPYSSDTLTVWFCGRPVCDTLTAPTETALPSSRPPLVSMQFLAENSSPCFSALLNPSSLCSSGAERRGVKSGTQSGRVEKSRTFDLDLVLYFFKV